MESKVHNKEFKIFFTRAFSAFFFVPFILIPIFLKGLLLYFSYIILLSLMIVELKNMIKIANKKFLLNMYMYVCIFTIFVFIIYVSSINQINKNIIEIIMTIWIFDTFCYLGGKMFNGKKLIPTISKGKTFNGLYSGIVASILIAGIYSIYIYGDLDILFFLVLPTLLLAFLGDLTVSILKLGVNIKDTGNIMPGHGGIIDRMDSFIFVFFFFEIYLLILT